MLSLDYTKQYASTSVSERERDEAALHRWAGEKESEPRICARDYSLDWITFNTNNWS